MRKASSSLFLETALACTKSTPVRAFFLECPKIVRKKCEIGKNQLFDFNHSRFFFRFSGPIFQKKQNEQKRTSFLMKKNQNKPQNRSITAATGKISADQLDQELQIRGPTDSKWNIFRHPRPRKGCRPS